MVFATIADLLEIDATLQDYGIQEWDTELLKAGDDIVKLLKVRWWNTYLKSMGLYSGTYTLDETLLDPTQWTEVSCYYALAYYILPKLSKFESDADRFRNMMDYYAGRFNDLIDLEIRSGVRYDADSDSQFSTSEQKPTVTLRLVR